MKNVFIFVLYLMASTGMFSERSIAQETHVQLPGASQAVHAINYQSIQAAIDAVPEAGGIVVLPPGEFKIYQPLIISRSDFLIRGAGTATHIQNMNNSGQPGIIIQPDSTQTDPESLWRVQLEDFRLTGNDSSGHGLVARDVNELFIHGITTSYHGGDGILLDYCYEDPRISNSLITYNKGIGLNLIGCHDIIVSDNQFEENQDALHCVDGFNLCMTGNNLDDHLGNGVVIENTYGSVLSGNMIEECADFAVMLDRDCYGITVGANVIAHNGGGVYLADAHGCSISANTFTIMKANAVKVDSLSSRINITGNNFSNSYIGEGEVKRNPDDLAAAGITLESTKHILMAGNIFSGLTTPAVKVISENNRHMLFNSNLLIDVESQHQELKNSMIKNNLKP